MALSFHGLGLCSQFEEAILQGADVNAVDIFDGSTALSTVSEFNVFDAISNYRDIIALFKKHGANVDHTDNKGYTALLKSDSDNYSTALLEHGASTEITLASGIVASALVEAAISCHVGTITYLVETRGLDVNKIIDHERGRSALHMACEILGRVAGDAQLEEAFGVEQLIMYGAAVDATDNDGKTPLHA